MATINGIYSASSPYYNTSIVNSKFLDVMINRGIPMQPSDVYWKITPVYQYRPDMLAYDLYTDSRLWWVFAQRNPNTLADPYGDFITDTGIYLPKLDLLKQVLGI